MKVYLPKEKIQEQLQLAFALLKINIGKMLLQLAKSPAPLLGPMPVNWMSLEL